MPAETLRPLPFEGRHSASKTRVNALMGPPQGDGPTADKFGSIRVKNMIDCLMVAMP